MKTLLFLLPVLFLSGCASYQKSVYSRTIGGTASSANGSYGGSIYDSVVYRK